MADKSRNFRSSYYDKVGFRSVEEKKSLEILMNESPMDIEKLKKFCSRFVLPSVYREYVWQVVLGFLPVHVESHSSLTNVWKEQYDRILEATKNLFNLRETTPEIHVIMFRMTQDIETFDMKELTSCPKAKNLIALASFFKKFSSSDLIAYSLFKHFALHQREYEYTSPSNLKPMRENFENILKKEDETLYEHLKSKKILDKLPVCTWFERCFLDVLHESSLARVFDKIIGGSFIILPYVATALLVGNRHLLLELTDDSKISEIFENISEDTSDAAVNKALDMLHFAAVLERESEQYRSKNIAKS